MRKSHIFCGMGQLPSDTDISQHKYMTILLEVDMVTGVIMDFHAPVYCEMMNDFLSSIFRGKSLDDGIETIILELDERLHVVSKKALINALHSLYNRYLMTKRRKGIVCNKAAEN